MKYSKNQESALVVIIIIILSGAIVGTLGYLAWSNFLAPKSDNTQESVKNTLATEDGNAEPSKTFTNEELTFEYPREGWQLVESGGADDIALLQTDNYKPSIGMGLDAGASILIYLTNQQEVPMVPGIKDVEEIQVDGNKGFKYSVEYEGYRLAAFFTVMVDAETGYERNYAISMQTVGEATDSEREAFDLVIESLDIK